MDASVIYYLINVSSGMCSSSLYQSASAARCINTSATSSFTTQVSQPNALPVAPDGGISSSTKVTSNSRRAKCHTMDTPVIPASTTMTLFSGHNALLLCEEHVMPDVKVISYRQICRIAKLEGTDVSGRRL